jgi:acyl carrier protein
MGRREETLKLIYDGIDEVNSSPETRETIEKSPETVLIGEGGSLDSLGFVTLAVEIEGHVERKFKKTITLMEVVEVTDECPLTVARLADFIDGLIE